MIDCFIFLGFLNIAAEVLLAFSIAISLKTCVVSRYKLVNVEKEGFFPSVGILLVLCCSLASVLGRVMAILMYFGPSLGLFDLLNHWRREQMRYRPISEGGPYEEGANLTTHNVSLPWTDIERNITSHQTSYTIYTGMSIKWLYVMMLVGMVIHVAIVYLIKTFSSSHFR